MTIEKRTFINKEKYEQLNNFFKQNSSQTKHLYQIIYKYKSELDFRLIFDRETAYLRLRGVGNQTDDIIIDIKSDQLTNIKDVLRNLGMHEETKWYRHRIIYKTNIYTITIDETYQYGYVVSISKEVENVEQTDTVHNEIEKIFEMLNIAITTKEQFNDRYKYYKVHWLDKLQNIDEDKFLNKEYQ